MKWTTEQILIFISALILFGLGSWLFINPFMLNEMGIMLETPTARIDARATYGGFDIGIGVFLFAALMKPHWHRIALVVAGCAIGGFGLGRIGGIAIEGGGEPLMWIFFAIELAMVIAIVTVLKKETPSR